MIAVNNLKHDSIIFNGERDDPSIIKLVVSKKNFRRTITFTKYEPGAFLDFYNYIYSNSLNANVDAPNKKELSERRIFLIKEILKNPYQDGILNIYNNRDRSFRVDTLIN
jgi:hypothetical protein